MMEILIFDRKIETLRFIYEQFNSKDNNVTLAENGSKFIAYFLNRKNYHFDAIIVCRKELDHYGIEEKYFLENGFYSIIMGSYLHCDDYHIHDIKISNLNCSSKKKAQVEKQIRNILEACEKKEILDQDFIYKLPKKSGILLKHLIMNKNTGLSDEEIAELFWGKNYSLKRNCIYNHVYNLRKSLKSEFKDSYIIHKDANRYKLIELKKGA